MNFGLDKLFIIIATILLFAGCQKQEEAPSAWTRLTDFPGEKRAFAGGAQINGKGYLVFGLIESGKNSKEIWEFDKQGNSWKKIASYEELLDNGRTLVTASSEKIYILNGSSQVSYIDSIVEFDLSSYSFKKINLPNELLIKDNMLFANGGNLYVHGESKTKVNNEIVLSKKFFKYQINKNQWSELPFINEDDIPKSLFVSYYGSLPIPTFTIDNKFYLINGQGVLWAFDTITEQWTNLGKAASDGYDVRYGSFNFKIGKYVYLMGGYIHNLGIYSKKMFRYDYSTNTWTDLGFEFPGDERTGAAGFTMDNRAYMCMGLTRNGLSLKDVWVFSGDERQSP